VGNDSNRVLSASKLVNNGLSMPSFCFSNKYEKITQGTGPLIIALLLLIKVITSEIKIVALQIN
jgi:hypothetical protein